MCHLAPNTNILLVIVARIGDTLLTTPIMRAIKENYPTSSLTVIAHPKRLSLLENTPFIDQLIPAGRFNLFIKKFLLDRKWEVALVYGENKYLTNFALKTSKIVLAYPGPHSKNPRITHPPAMTSYEHAIDGRAKLLKPLNIQLTNKKLSFFVTEPERLEAIRWLEKNKINKRTLIGIQPSSFHTKSYRNWPSENFAHLANNLLDAYANSCVIIFGGPDDSILSSEIKSKIKGHVVSTEGKLSIRITAALISLLDLYIGVDTGPTHIAGAIGVPMIALYHCEHPGRFLRPLQRSNCIIIEHPSTGKNCGRNTSMSEISVQQVVDASITLLNKEKCSE